MLDRLKQDADLSMRSGLIFLLHDVVAEKKRRYAKARL